MIDSLALEIRDYRSFIGEPVRLEFPRTGFLGLIGTNNAGKSSLLRLFFELRPLFKNLRDYSRSGNGNMNSLLSGVADTNGAYHTLIGERVFPTGSDAEPCLTLEFPPSPRGEGDHLWPRRAHANILRAGGFRLHLEMREGLLPAGPTTSVANVTGANDQSPIFDVGGRQVDLTPLNDAAAVLADAVYVGPFRNAINIGAEQSYFDLAVGDAFIRQLSDMKSGPDSSSNEAVFELTEELARIFKFRSLDINPAPDHRSIQLIVDGRSYRSSELGAGLAHFLLVATTVLTRRPSLLLLDEPELNLHPALQVDFLTMLASYATFGVGYSTHSIGLARSTADRLYAVTRDEAGVSRCLPYEATPELASLLGQLGYSGVNDFQYDGVLLVEGITDVRTFLQLLRLFGKEHRFAIVPLGGQDFMKRDIGVELAEIMRLSSNVVAVLDSERTAEGAEVEHGRLAFKEACEELNARCHILERRSIESYFPARAVRAVYGDAGRALEPFESTKAAKFGWSKHKNWRVAREVTAEELGGTDLGTILSEL